MARVRIVRKGNTMQVGGSAHTGMPGMGDKSLSYPISDPLGGMQEATSVNKTLKPIARQGATLEAEKGESVVTDLAKIGIPQHFNIGGKRHYDGGTPLNLPNDSFIFSRDKTMKIKDDMILEQFGKKTRKGKRSFTPAEIAKQYQNNKYLKILMDPDSSRMQRDTAEMMIENNNLKLGALAMVQESRKGFPDGIPGVAMPYMERLGLTPEQLVPQQEPQEGQQGPPQQEQPPMEMPQMAQGMKAGGSTGKTRVRIKKTGGSIPSYQKGGGFRHPIGPMPGITWEQWDNMSPQEKERASPTDNPVEVNGEIVPSTSNKSTKHQNIPDDAVKWDMTTEGYDESQVQPGDYILKEDGKWYRTTGYTQKNYGYEDSRLGELQPAYGHLQNTITGNEDLQNAIYINYQKHIQDSNLSKEKKDRLLKMPKDQVINTFLQGQKQVYAISNSGALYQHNEDGSIKEDVDGNPIMKSEKDLKVWEKRDSPEYYKRMKELGFSEDELFSGEMTAVFQAAYRGLEDASLDEQFTETLGNFNITPVGLKDSHGMHTYDGKAISPVDEIFGNTTAGQAVLPIDLDKDLTTEEVEWTPDGVVDTPEGLKVPPQGAPNADFWLQDVVKNWGAFSDRARISKEAPWQGQAAVKLADPTFFDPTRELAANAELANIATQGAAMFAGPQAYNARSSQIQGQAAQNAANILSQYNQKNVGTANQFEMANTQIMNQAAQQRSQLATQLWDKNAILNQQYKNSKNKAIENQRQSYIDALTNRAQTQALNSLYPQYNVDPMSGGFLDYDAEAGRRRKLEATQSQNKTITDSFARIKRENAGIDDATAYKLASKEAGMPDDTPYGAEAAYYGNYLGNMAGHE